jgi:hypothetical protein
MLQWSWIAYSWSSHRPLGVRTCLGLLVEFTVYADGFQYGRWLRILGDLLDWTILSLLLYCFLPIDPVPAAVMVVTRSCNAREYRKHQVLSDLNPVIDLFSPCWGHPEFHADGIHMHSVRSAFEILYFLRKCGSHMTSLKPECETTKNPSRMVWLRLGNHVFSQDLEPRVNKRATWQLSLVMHEWARQDKV